MKLYRFLASDRELKDYKFEDNSKIISSLDMSIASNYTSKKNCALIEWNYSEENVDSFIAYIKEHLKMCPRIEIWNTTTNTDNTIIKKCSKNILTKENIKEVLSTEQFDSTKCLVVYNA